MTRRSDPRTARRAVPAGQLPTFTPVPRQCERHDGWTPARQRSFIEALADTGSVAAACKAVDMSTVGAYYLRRQEGAEEFRAAWDAALDCGVRRVEDVVMDRALNGVEEPLYSYGKLIGSRRRYNDRLLMFILRNRAPERFSEGKRVSGMGGLNAVGQMELERLKKQWRKDWDAERAKVTTADVQASIERKVVEVRKRVEAEQATQWAKLSDETRTTWTRFVEMRDRDLDAAAADEAARALVDVGPTAKDWPPTVPPGPKPKPPAPEPRKTVWKLTDDDMWKP